MADTKKTKARESSSTRIAVYAGSFDPITNGHLDILARALEVFDDVIVAIANNPKKNALFSAPERAELIRGAAKDHPDIARDVTVEIFPGLLIDFARTNNIKSIVRGLRAVADFEFEFQLALMNRRLEPSIDTVFLMTDERNFYVSSSLVKEVATFGGDISDFVPDSIKIALLKKIGA